MDNMKLFSLIGAIILLSAMFANIMVSSPTHTINTIKANNFTYNVSFPGANVLWSYPIGGNHPYVSQYSKSLYGFGGVGVLGGNITGDGYIDFLLPYYDTTYKNATLTAIDGGNGKVIWEININNYLSYYMAGTLGKIPLIEVISGNVSTPQINQPFYGPGYVNISMINGLDGYTIWNKTIDLINSNMGLFITTNETIFASTDPIISTYAIFTIHQSNVSNIFYAFNITVYGIKNINGMVAFVHQYSSLSVYNGYYYFPLYLAIDKVPGLESGGIFYTYLQLSSAGIVTANSVLVSSNGSTIWNVTSPYYCLILSDGYNLGVSIALGNFTGGVDYDIAYSFVAITVSSSLQPNFGIAVLNITTGKYIYTKTYGQYGDPGLSQFVMSTPFIEYDANIDNATGGYGPTIDLTGNGIPDLIVTEWSRNESYVENVSLINVFQNKVVWTTFLTGCLSYSGAAFSPIPLKFNNISYMPVFVFPQMTGEIYLLNGTNGQILASSLDPNAMAYPYLGYLSVMINNPTYFSKFALAGIYPYIPKNMSTSNLLYNVTLLNISSKGNVINKTLVLPYSNALISYFVSLSFFGFNYYITANLDQNSSNNWTDNLYVMSTTNLSVIWKYTAKNYGQDPSMMFSPSWNYFRLMYPHKYNNGNLTNSKYQYVFPLQTINRFYMLSINNTQKLSSHFLYQYKSGYAPLTDTFNMEVTGGVAPYSYKWYINNTLLNNSGSILTYTFNVQGIYNISVVAIDQLSQTTYGYVVVVVYPQNITKALYKIEGFVKNSTGNPISNVSVFLNNSLISVTNNSGVFIIMLPNGTYNINFTHPEYKNYSYKLIVDGQNLSFSIYLTQIYHSNTTYSTAKTSARYPSIIIIITIITGIGIIGGLFIVSLIKRRRKYK